jgi:uncharacterized protein YgiM (DUF1202 family)
MKHCCKFIFLMTLVACLCGCNSHSEPINESTEQIEPSTICETESMTVETSENSTEETAPLFTEPTEPEFFTNEYGRFMRVNETVKTEAKVFLRKSPNGKKVDVVGDHISLTRVGIGDDGWSIVLYKNSEAYVPSYYLYSDKIATYTEVDELVYAVKDANVRNGSSINCSKVGEVKENQVLKRVAIGDNGWSRVLYKDKEVYIYSLYVAVKNDKEETNPTTIPDETKPSTDDFTGEIVSFEENGVVYIVVNDVVEAARNVNVRSGPSVECEKIGQLAGGKTVQRIAVGDNGWSKVLFNGVEAYIYSEYLIS